eukprot:3223720-Rhodomonas_salina.1
MADGGQTGRQEDGGQRGVQRKPTASSCGARPARLDLSSNRICMPRWDVVEAPHRSLAGFESWLE